MFKNIPFLVLIFCSTLISTVFLLCPVSADEPSIVLTNIEVKPEIFCPGKDGAEFKATLLIYEDEDFARLKISIKNGSGKRVAELWKDIRLPDDVDDDDPINRIISITWNGKNELGKPLPDGTYSYTAQAFLFEKDDDELEIESRSNKMTGNLIIDQTPPEIFILSPGEGEIFNDPEIVISGSILDSNGISFSELICNDRIIPLKLDSHGNFAESVILKEGENLIMIRGVDHAGNQNEKSIKVILAYKPEIEFSVDPFEIILGESAKLSWNTRHAQEITLEPGYGKVPASGHLFVTPKKTTTYVLKAKGLGGETSREITLIVYYPPTAKLTAEPEEIPFGGSSVLTWFTEHADTAILEPGIGAVETSGSISVSPSTTTQYTLAAEGPGGQTKAQTTVTVNQKPELVLLSSAEELKTADVRYLIRWTDSDEDDNAFLSLYYDTDDQGADGILIQSSIPEDPDGPKPDSFIWDTSFTAEGSYYVYAVISDELNEPLIVYSSSPIVIDHPPFQISGEKIHPIEPIMNCQFGYSIDLQEDTLIAGAIGYPLNGKNSGGAYLFRNQNGTLVEESLLLPKEPSLEANFGKSVALNGDTAVVGRGSAYVFHRSAYGWEEVCKLTVNHGSPEEGFGSAVDINHEYIAVGAPTAATEGSTTGAVYLFKKEGGTWVQHSRLSAPTLESQDRFGHSLSLGHDLLLVGAPGKNGGKGAVFVYKLFTDEWLLQYQIMPDEKLGKSQFGFTLDLHQKSALIGAPLANERGAAFIYELQHLHWKNTAVLDSSDCSPGDLFGQAVSLDQNYAGVGAPGQASNRGAVYLYMNSGNGWKKISQLVPDISASTLYFGHALGLKKGFLAVGAYGDSSVLKRAGSLFYYSVPYSSVSLNATPVLLRLGQPTNFTWSTQEIYTCEIIPGIGEVDLNGSEYFAPERTTLFKLSGKGPLGTAEDQKLVRVIDPGKMPEINFVSDKTVIGPGETILLSWETDHADEIFLEPAKKVLDPTGTLLLAPELTTTYILRARGPGGTEVRQVSVTVKNNPPTFKFTQPDGISDIADHPFMIRWEDSDPDDNAAISLFYDMNDSGGDGILIKSGIPEDPEGSEGDSMKWDTSLMPEGSYYLYAVIDDGLNSIGPVYSPGSLKIDHSYPELKESIFQADDFNSTDYDGTCVAMDDKNAVAVNNGLAYFYENNGTSWIETNKTRIIDGSSPNTIDIYIILCSEEIMCDKSGVASGQEVDLIPGTCFGDMELLIKSPSLTQSDLIISSLEFLIDGKWESKLSDAFWSGSGTYIPGVGRILPPTIDPEGHCLRSSYSTWDVSYFNKFTKIRMEFYQKGTEPRDYATTAAISGDFVLIGSPYHGQDGSILEHPDGAAYMYQKTSTGWELHTTLSPPGSSKNQRFGYSVDIKGNTAVIGAPGSDAHGSGAAYIYRYDGEFWNLVSTLTASDTQNAVLFGASVSLDREIIAVGVPYYLDGGMETGAVYLFKENGGNWVEEEKIIPTTSHPNGSFGKTIDLAGDTLFIGAPRDMGGGVRSGSVTIYEKNLGHWVQTNKIIPESPVPGDEFGLALAVHGDYVAVGAPFSDYFGNGFGEINLYRRNGLQWENISRFAASDAYDYHGFGRGVALKNNIIMTGGLYWEEVTHKGGEVYFYSFPGATADLRADPWADPGGNFNLMWKTQYTEINTLEPGIGMVPSEGTTSVHIGEDTTYTLVGKGIYGTSVDSVSLKVKDPPPDISFSASPGAIPKGGKAVLTWDSAHGDQAVIHPGVGTVPVKGSIEVSPSQTTLYTLTIQGPGGKTSQGARVEIGHPPAAGIITDPFNEINAGENALLSWEVMDAETVMIEPGIGNVPDHGSVSVSPLETTSYRLTASGPFGTTTVSHTLEVYHAPPVLTFTANPLEIYEGETSVLTWTSLHASEVILSPGFGPVDLNGSVTVTPKVTTQFTLEATGPGGVAKETVTVTVKKPPGIYYEYDALGRIKKIIQVPK